MLSGCRYRVVTANAGAAGAELEATCTPAVTVWPGAMKVAHCAPLQVTVCSATEHSMPQELAMPVAPGSRQETLQPVEPPASVTETSAT